MSREAKGLITFWVIALVVLGAIVGIGVRTSAKTTRYERFVQVDEELICPEYDLGVQLFLGDGSTKQESYDVCYLVDRVSRLVYIHVSEHGPLDSGMVMLECKDAEGNHMKYTGELPD